MDAFAHPVRSLATNYICEGGKMEGLQALCDMLKTNNTLQSIKCACCVV